MSLPAPSKGASPCKGSSIGLRLARKKGNQMSKVGTKRVMPPLLWHGGGVHSTQFSSSRKADKSRVSRDSITRAPLTVPTSWPDVVIAIVGAAKESWHHHVTIAAALSLGLALVACIDYGTERRGQSTQLESCARPAQLVGQEYESTWACI